MNAYSTSPNFLCKVLCTHYFYVVGKDHSISENKHICPNVRIYDDGRYQKILFLSSDTLGFEQLSSAIGGGVLQLL